MNTYTHAQFAETRQADRLLTAEYARTARAARAAQPDRRVSAPRRHRSAPAIRRAGLLAWARTA